jgi:hypothetical protein
MGSTIHLHSGVFEFKSLLCYQLPSFPPVPLSKWREYNVRRLSIMKPTWCTFHSIYWESRASTCFEHYSLILRRRYTTALGIMRACNVSWQCHDCSETAIVALPSEDEQVMLETCRDSWFSINWMKSASRWYRYTDILWFTVSKTLSSYVGSFLTTIKS